MPVTKPLVPRDMVESLLAATHGHALLYGPPGTGKTTSAASLAAPGQRVRQITIKQGMSAAYFVGQLLPREDGPGFR